MKWRCSCKGCFNIKILSLHWRDSQYKDKTVSRQLIFIIGILHLKRRTLFAMSLGSKNLMHDFPFMKLNCSLITAVAFFQMSVTSPPSSRMAMTTTVRPPFAMTWAAASHQRRADMCLDWFPTTTGQSKMMQPQMYHHKLTLPRQKR